MRKGAFGALRGAFGRLHRLHRRPVMQQQHLLLLLLCRRELHELTP
jgi:hypothetical protein